MNTKNRRYVLVLYTVRSNTSVSVADTPALKQNFMATLCSFSPFMTCKVLYPECDGRSQVRRC